MLVNFQQLVILEINGLIIYYINPLRQLLTHAIKIGKNN